MSKTISSRFTSTQQRNGMKAEWMKTKVLIAAVALSAATGYALADDIYPYVDFSHVQSTKTRAEVQNELANETLAEKSAKNLDYAPPPVVVSGKTRTEVRAELANETPAEKFARNLDYVPPTRIVSEKTRADVQAEQAKELAKGKLENRRNSSYAGT